MERKAIENLEAARLLMTGDDPCPNAAASRAYYAAYQACWALLVAEDHRPEKSDRGTYFPHKTLPEIAVRTGVLTKMEGDQLEFLESQRVVADYFEDQISAKIGHQCVSDAETLVALLHEPS